MIVRLIFRDPTWATYEVAPPVEYGWSARVPVEGEELHADGTDSAMPEQVYHVKMVIWIVGATGCQRADVHVYPQDSGAWGKSS